MGGDAPNVFWITQGNSADLVPLAINICPLNSELIYFNCTYMYKVHVHDKCFGKPRIIIKLRD